MIHSSPSFDVYNKVIFYSGYYKNKKQLTTQFIVFIVLYWTVNGTIAKVNFVYALTTNTSKLVRILTDTFGINDIPF